MPPKPKPSSPKKKLKPTWHIYAIECDNKSIYIGLTKDLKNRWNQHSTGKGGADWTKKHKPVRIFPIEKAKTLKEAMNKERQWKTSTGRNRLKKMISMCSCIGLTGGTILLLNEEDRTPHGRAGARPRPDAHHPPDPGKKPRFT